MMKDLGPYPNWEEAFDKARQLFEDGEIQAISTMSVPEFKKEEEKFSTTPLVPEIGGTIDNLNLIAKMEPPLHGAYHHLRLWIQPTEKPHDALNALVMCVLYEGQDIKIDFSE